MTRHMLNVVVPLAIFAAGMAAAVSAAFWGADVGPLDWTQVAGSSYYLPTRTPSPTAAPSHPPVGGTIKLPAAAVAAQSHTHSQTPNAVAPYALLAAGAAFVTACGWWARKRGMVSRGRES
jgi:hypothetical protein